MALETIRARFGRALSDLFGTGSGKLRNILVELQGLRTDYALGAAANTNIPIVDIATEDTLVRVVELDFTLTEGIPNTRTWTAPVNRTAVASITSAGNIQLTVDTTAKLLAITWFNKK